MSDNTLTPEYINEFIGNQTVAVATTFIILEVFFVLSRFVSRHVCKTATGLDDIFILPALLFCLAICVLAIVMVEFCGVGRHESVLAVLDPVRITNWAKSLVAVECIYCTAVVFPKLSILGFYLRIFTTKPYRIVAWILSGLMLANLFAAIIVSLTACIPLAARWDPSAYPNAVCINVMNYWRWISFANMFTDVAMLILPLPAVWKLHASRNTKFGLTLVFLTGSLGLVSSIVRFAIFFGTNGFVDGTWSSTILMIWTLVEPGIYLIAACLPSLRPLVLYIIKGSIEPSHNASNMRASKDIKLASKLGGSRSGMNGAKGAGFLRLPVKDGGAYGDTEMGTDDHSLVSSYRYEINNGAYQANNKPRNEIGVKKDFSITTTSQDSSRD
ncbi:hypothetical protein MMC26_003417 [Xylographa opegraphella]|nr:hypothetical protein [Xylographa opegraphella]